MSEPDVDPQTMFNVVLGILSTAFGWFSKTLYDVTQELRKDIGILHKNLGDLHVELARDYTPVKRFEEATNKINEKLDTIIDRLSRK